MYYTSILRRKRSSPYFKIIYYAHHPHVYLSFLTQILYYFRKIQVLHAGGITSLRAGLAETDEDGELDASRACAQGQGGSSASVARMSTAYAHAARAPSLTQGLRGGKTSFLYY